MTERQREDKSLLKEPLPQAEEKVLSFWKDINLLKKVEEKSQKPRGILRSTKDFVFYEGPPTANGRPGIHHLVSRAFKDVVLRYKTMQGFNVRRRGGWDTHGLPVELQVEKEIGIKSKKDIEEYGVEKFNEKCRESVWTYIEEWERFTDRIGYMLDQKNAYVTYKPEYIESVWNIVSKIAEQDLLYKDYKVLPWCPRCGTALSSHELAQGYQDDKDLSVYVKFPIVEQAYTYFLAWTTTPWTLPGHVALAVGKDIEYVKVKQQNEFYILAKNRLSILSEGFEIVEEKIGKDLVGLKYEPPFPFLNENLPAGEKTKLEKAFQVYEAGFVNTEDGTGIVHTAVMYGQDDFELGTKIGLPKFHLVDESGHFIKGTGFLEGKFVKSEETDVEIIKDLAHRNLLFKKEKHTHSYPHCWRCKTPLIYYARDSWYIKMSKLRDKLVSENKKIHWEPGYIRDGRFGEWLTDVKDWALSRERYWGTPIPVWESEDGDRLVVDSVETLKNFSKKSKNKYFLMRHAESEKNVSGVINADLNNIFHLTEKGKQQAIISAQKLKTKNIDIIFSSPFSRCSETAEIVKKALNLSHELNIDDRLWEIKTGTEFEGKKEGSNLAFYKSQAERFDIAPSGGETFVGLTKRVGEFMYELENKYEGKNILIVTHAAPISFIKAVATGAVRNKLFDIREKEESKLQYAEFQELEFKKLPHDKNFELDLHKPFIDEIVLEKSGKEYKRIKEVMDVWFDSGAMPFAQDHYPFENKKRVDGGGYPADYICEAIDQTRGWFYTLHAIGNLLGKGRAFRNVICLGHLLDKDGKKMSKSLGNVVDPWEAMKEFGADPIRFWMFAVKEPGEPKNFDPESVRELSRKVFALLTNVYSFYEMYKVNDEMDNKSKNILDKWILSKLDETYSVTTKALDEYRIIEAARSIRDFIADLSQWYIRRSRDRMRDPNTEDAKSALKTTRFVLHTMARIMAPFSPFYAEMLWINTKISSDPESVHLAEWPKLGQPKNKLNANMDQVRVLVSKVLEQRARANIKIRQPLKDLKIKNKELGSNKELVEIMKDELNVKEIVFDKNLTEELVLNTEITPELKAEGYVREVMRKIMDLRKERGLMPKDVIEELLIVDLDENISILKEAEETIKSKCNVGKVSFSVGAGEISIKNA